MATIAVDAKEAGVPKAEKSRASSSFSILVIDKDKVDAGHESKGKTNAQGRRRGGNKQAMMISRGQKGTIEWFSFQKGFGFIKVDSTDKDLFVHRSEFLRDGPFDVFYLIGKGYKVEFDIVRRSNGLEAVAVTGADGQKVPGYRKPVQRLPVTIPKDTIAQGKQGPQKEKLVQKSEEKLDGMPPKKSGRRFNRNRKKRLLKEIDDEEDEKEGLGNVDIKEKFFEKVRRRIQSAIEEGKEDKVVADAKEVEGRRRISSAIGADQAHAEGTKPNGKRRQRGGRRHRKDSELKPGADGKAVENGKLSSGISITGIIGKALAKPTEKKD